MGTWIELIIHFDSHILLCLFLMFSEGSEHARLFKILMFYPT